MRGAWLGLLGTAAGLVLAASAGAISAPIRIHGTGSDGVLIRPTPDTSQPARGWMPEGTSPDYNCFTYGQMIGNVNVWFSVNYSGITGYYASYWDDSSYQSEAELTAKYGIPKCGSTPAPPAPPPPAPPAPPQPGPGAGVTPEPGGPAPTTLPTGGSVFFLPEGNNLRKTKATTTLAYSTWRGSNCAYKGAVPAVVGNRRVSTLAGWSNGRLGPIYYLRANKDLRREISYILIIDPGAKKAFEGEGCDDNVNPGRVLSDWLALDPANSRLVIIAAEATNEDDRVGLGRWYLKELTKRQRTRQVRLCDEGNLSHTKAFDQFASPTGSQTAFLTARKFQCPYGVPTVDLSGPYSGGRGW